MTLVLVSNNLGIMWVGIEATTLLTAFLICVHVSRRIAGGDVEIHSHLLRRRGVRLHGNAAGRAPRRTGLVCARRTSCCGRRCGARRVTEPRLLKAAFIFLLVGYGTKAGLAPMHNWLPDAHSQAPAPVSALFSGFMLNTALYCIMRYVPIVEAATGNTGWGLRLLIGFGLFSILVAAAFILFQHDLKRLLAYHSVEHIGIIALGVGLGGLGTFAALFHTLNHSLVQDARLFCRGPAGTEVIMKVLFAGGGTAGHINPALAVAGYLREKEPDAKILYIGAKGGMEERLVPAAGFDFRSITVAGFQRKLNWKNVKRNAAAAVHVFTASREARRIIREFQPDICVGTGGYVAGPVIREADEAENSVRYS